MKNQEVYTIYTKDGERFFIPGASSVEALASPLLPKAASANVSTHIEGADVSLFFDSSTNNWVVRSPCRIKLKQFDKMHPSSLIFLLNEHGCIEVEYENKCFLRVSEFSGVFSTIGWAVGYRVDYGEWRKKEYFDETEPPDEIHYHAILGSQFWSEYSKPLAISAFLERLRSKNPALPSITVMSQKPDDLALSKLWGITWGN